MILCYLRKHGRLIFTIIVLTVLNVYFSTDLRKKLGAKRDSGGLIIYIRSHLFDKSLIVHKDSDDIIWLGLKPGVLADDFVF